MRRIGLAVVLVFDFVLLPLAGEAQEAVKVYRIGYLSFPPVDARLDAFREGLRDLGYIEGRNIVLEIRSAEGKPDRLPDLVADLVRRKVDLIATTTGAAAIVAKKATPTIPIVMLASGDAVHQGLAASLAHPGGNVTGLTMIAPDLSRKRVEVLTEMLPRVMHLGVLWCGGVLPKYEWAETKAATDPRRIRLTSLEAQEPGDLASAFTSAATQRVEAVLGFDCPNLTPSLIAQLSLKHRLPGMFPSSGYPRAGCLMSYGASFADAPKRAATYVDKILKGAKPADLPIEQPTKFELVINVKTAKALGLTIPQTLLVRADQIIDP